MQCRAGEQSSERALKRFSRRSRLQSRTLDELARRVKRGEFKAALDEHAAVQRTEEASGEPTCCFTRSLLQLLLAEAEKSGSERERDVLLGRLIEDGALNTAARVLLQSANAAHGVKEAFFLLTAVAARYPLNTNNVEALLGYFAPLLRAMDTAVELVEDRPLRVCQLESWAAAHDCLMALAGRPSSLPPHAAASKARLAYRSGGEPALAFIHTRLKATFNAGMAACLQSLSAPAEPAWAAEDRASLAAARRALLLSLGRVLRLAVAQQAAGRKFDALESAAAAVDAAASRWGAAATEELQRWTLTYVHLSAAFAELQPRSAGVPTFCRCSACAPPATAGCAAGTYNALYRSNALPGLVASLERSPRSRRAVSRLLVLLTRGVCAKAEAARRLLSILGGPEALMAALLASAGGAAKGRGSSGAGSRSAEAALEAAAARCVGDADEPAAEDGESLSESESAVATGAEAAARVKTTQRLLSLALCSLAGVEPAVVHARARREAAAREAAAEAAAAELLAGEAGLPPTAMVVATPPPASSGKKKGLSGSERKKRQAAAAATAATAAAVETATAEDPPAEALSAPLASLSMTGLPANDMPMDLGALFPWLAQPQSEPASPPASQPPPPPPDARHEDDGICIICLDNERSSALPNCAHPPVLCGGCLALVLSKPQPRRCPLCGVAA